MWKQREDDGEAEEDQVGGHNEADTEETDPAPAQLQLWRVH
jgi:hypothetical protein